MSKKVHGICRLCGYHKKLTYEHIPPKSAFNDQHLVFQTMQNMLEGHKNKHFRKGMGEYSLCEKCNNTTGGWYGEAFVDWTRQGLDWFDKLGDRSFLSLPYYIKPLRVIKQALVMAVAMSSERTQKYHSELRRFLLNKEQKYLPPKYKVYVYFKADGQPRFASGMAIMKVDSGRGSFVEAEVSLPPFGYCIATPIKGTKSLAEYHGLYNITWFSEYGYDDWVPIHLRLPTRATHEPLPLDYRSEQEIQENYSNN